MMTGEVYLASMATIVTDYRRAMEGLLIAPKDCRRQIKIAIDKMVDDILTENMYWADSPGLADVDRYEGMFNLRQLTPTEAKNFLNLIDEMISDVYTVLDKTIELPTWFMLNVKFSTSDNLIITVEQDYRIYDWMRRYNQRPKRRVENKQRRRKTNG